MSWHIVSWDEENVGEALKRGRYADVSLPGWGRLEDWVALNYELGVVEELEKLRPSLARESYIPDWFVGMGLQFWWYVGDESISGMPRGLYREAGVLRRLGVTALELREGFDASRNGGEHTPCPVDSLRYPVQGIEPEAYYTRFKAIWKRIVEAGLVKGGGGWILDATKIEVEGEYAGMGVVREVIETVDQGGRHHKRIQAYRGAPGV